MLIIYAKLEFCVNIIEKYMMLCSQNALLLSIISFMLHIDFSDLKTKKIIRKLLKLKSCNT